MKDVRDKDLRSDDFALLAIDVIFTSGMTAQVSESKGFLFNIRSS